MIIQALNKRQKERGGYLTDVDLHGVAAELHVPLHRVQALVSFFPHYRTEPPMQVEVHVCRDMTCHLRGSVDTLDHLSRWARVHHPNEIHVSGVSCLGRCDRAPAALVNEQLYVMRDAGELQSIALGHLSDDAPQPNSDWELAASKAENWHIDPYRNELDEHSPDYQTIRHYIANPDPDAVLKALETAGLLGMGGAGGRAFMKWQDVRQAKGTSKYIVCNGDESEPGTFKDRDLMLAAPHLAIEGMILAGLVVGASQGWIYLRHEYPEQAAAFQREILRAEKLGVLGSNILRSENSFKLEVFISPGNYICGEQTALIEAMEDKRAEPRNRPPELMTNGYQNQPTLLNNAETFSWVPAIMSRSAGAWFAKQGRKSGRYVADASESIRGMRFFSISGDVRRPGAYEVPTGIPLGELIDEYCGGMLDGKEIVAVALSGPSGGLLPPKIPIKALNRRFVEKHVPPGLTEIDIRDIPLDINVARAMDIMIGAGIVIYGTGADVLFEALACSRFFRNESCGKCVPCRIGSQKITEMGERLAEGRLTREELPMLQETAFQLSQTMISTSICGLGQVASNPMRSLFGFFPQRVQEALKRSANAEQISQGEAMRSETSIDFSEIVTIGARVADDEGMFARDMDGRLLRMQKAAAADFDTDVNLKINGQAITVKRAVPTVDSEGAILRAEDGQPIPRYTTIYDAAEAAFVKSTSDQHPIPTLCHREHLPPVGVCRVCIVEAAEMTRRGLRKQLVPACIQRVSEGMEVHTFESGEDPDAARRVRTAASVVTELLLADHSPSFNSTDGREKDHETPRGSSSNELLKVAERLGIQKSRFEPTSLKRTQDVSSLMIAVNRDECIMCRRCERGCNWVKENFIIGLAGKGYNSHISFDLDDSMAQSNCVSCGECAVSCPTGALTFTNKFLLQQKSRVEAELRDSKHDGTVVPPEELTGLSLFSGIPIKFLQLNGSSVIRRVLDEGDVLCREGDYGASAFIIRSGSFAICQSSQSKPAAKPQPVTGILGWLGSFTSTLSKPSSGKSAKLADLGGRELLANQTLVCDIDDVILGEMTCMNRSRRSATIVAREPSEVLEIRRNVLDMLLRNRASREILDRVYRRRAVNQLQNLPIFSHLDESVRKDAANWLNDKVELVRAEPGQVIFQQGDLADDFYMVVLGFIKVSQRFGTLDRVATYLGPGKYFGEIGILSQFASSLPWKDENLRGLRTSTCSALDHVELFRIRGADFAGLLQRFPQMQSAFIENARRTLEQDRLAGVKLTEGIDDDFLDQGLFGAQNLLVLDLERCTRCDECTKACADTHQGVTRLIREGMRFDRYLIASSCRSCMDPYCMVGCPVDAIHRNGESLQIEIEDYCIGCGLCAENCPYGNINMHGSPKTEIDPRTGKERKLYQLVDGRKLPVVQQKATTCDICMEIDGRPSCVYACPHNAAFRVDSEGFKKLLARK